MKAMRHTGDSANIAYYRESGRPGKAEYWCQVMRIGIERVDGKWREKDRPTYYFTVCRYGVGEVARFTYTPRRVEPGRLREQTVTRLVREALS